jgi:glycosyltransferase involved in cell wall biosynthesis
MKDRRLKVLWHSNLPSVNSGYAIYSRDWLKRIKADGWPLAMSSFAGLGGGTIELENVMMYPAMADQWGADGMLLHARHFGAQVIIPMMDIWTLNPQFLQQINAEGRKIVYYVPIDQEPIPRGVLENLKYAYKIITFSNFGKLALEKEGYSSTMIHEGTDTNIFKPMDKMACRKELGLPLDKFMIGMIGANKENPSRKAWQEALEAFKLFHDKHPDSVFFYQSNQNIPGGFPIDEFAKHLGINTSVYHIDPYISLVHAGSEVMCKLMNAFDITTHASMTEGFGLVGIESQSCGTPIIVNNCHSMPELIIEGKTGEICKTGRKHYSNAGGIWYHPDVQSLYEKMEILYKKVTENENKVSTDCRNHIVEHFNIDKSIKDWIRELESLQTEILPPLDEKAKKK